MLMLSDLKSYFFFCRTVFYNRRAELTAISENMLQLYIWLDRGQINLKSV